MQLAQSAVLSLQVLDELQDRLQQGKPYEGQQKFKTVHRRFRSKRKLNDSYKLLEEGACMQLRDGQFTCGVELAQMLVQVQASLLSYRFQVDITSVSA